MRKRIIILLVAFILLVFNASAQYKLSGVVQNFKGEPISGVTIKVTDISNDSTMSNIEGKFDLTVPLGEHTFSASKENYKTFFFTLEGPNGYDIELGNVNGHINLGRSNKKKEDSSWVRNKKRNNVIKNILLFDRPFDSNFNTGWSYYGGYNGKEQDYKKAFYYI